MKSLKQNYDKHLVITIIVLVALPILLGSSTFVLISGDYQNQIISFFVQLFNNIEIGYDIGRQFLASLIQLQYVIFIVMLVLYPVYPFIFSLENHLGKRNPKSAVAEYQALKKIVYALLPIFFFAVALRISSAITQHNPLLTLVLSLDPLSLSIFVSIVSVVFFAVASALLRIILLNRSKHFKFYLARLSLKAMLRIEDDLERMKYLIEGLRFYNNYIRSTLGLQINDLKTIYSKIIADSTVDKGHLMKELCHAFEESDKLKPIRCLTVLFNVSDSERFLAKESIQKKLEHWGIIIGTLASAIAAVLGAIATLLSTSAHI
jgi:hypothetical protein